MPRCGEGREPHSLVEDGCISWTYAQCTPAFEDNTYSANATQSELEVLSCSVMFNEDLISSHRMCTLTFDSLICFFASLLLSESYTNCYKNIKLLSANTTRQLLPPRTHVVVSTQVSTILEKHVCNFREPTLQCQTKWS